PVKLAQREQKILTGPVHSWRKYPACPHRQHRGVEDCCPGVGAVAEVFGAVARSGGVGRVVGRLVDTAAGAVCLSVFPVGRHTAGVASRSVRCPGVGCQGARRGVANKQYVPKRGCWYLVAPELFGDGVRDLGECSGRGLKKSVARTYGYSGRTWTPLILPLRGGGGVERKVGWPGFPYNGKERAGTKGKSGMAGVPSQWKGTGRDKGREAGCKRGRKRSRSLHRERGWNRNELWTVLPRPIFVVY
ncbi:hypothetical protein MTP99_012930, partial [Tenebrio molitor]